MFSSHFQVSRKVLAVVCIVALLVSMFSTYAGLRVFGQAGTSLTTNTLSGGPQAGAADYTIFTENGYYYAKDAYGATTYSSNASQLIISCAQALTNGGTIFVKSGVYTIDKGSLRGGELYGLGCSIANLANITIRGEGPSTIFVPAGALQRIFTFDHSTNCKLLDLTLDGRNLEDQAYPNSSDALVIFDEGSHDGRIENCVLKNGGGHCDGAGVFSANRLTIVGCDVTATAHGLAIATSFYSHYYNNFIHNITGDGIVLSQVYTSNNIVESNIITNCSVNGIEINADVPTYAHNDTGAQYNIIRSNQISFCNRGIVVLTQANIVSDNIIQGCTNDAIQLNGMLGYSIDNIISGNKCLSSTSATEGFGIRETTGANWNMILNNQANFNTAGNIITLGVNTQVHSCYNGSVTWVT